MVGEKEGGVRRGAAMAGGLGESKVPRNGNGLEEGNIEGAIAIST